MVTSDGTTPGLSVVIITKDEGDNIVSCLQSVRWANETIVVDSHSTDDTVALAQAEGAITHQIEWQGFGAAKQQAVGFASHDWVLSLDADERITPELANEIRQAITSDIYAGYEIPRLTNFIGTWIHHSGWRPDYVLRLFRKSTGGFSDALVHEGVTVSGKVGRLKHDILHYSYRSLEDYLERLNRYTTLAAEELSANGARFRLWQALVKPPAIFIKRYFLKLGILDGWAGFQIAFLSAVYVFVKYAKLWRLSEPPTANSSTAVATDADATLTSQEPPESRTVGKL